jgi:hypothetical protein
LAKRLNADLAIIYKRRDKPNVAKAMAVIGNVQDKIAIILDDMADTAGTLTEAAAAVTERGPVKSTPVVPIRFYPGRRSIALTLPRSAVWWSPIRFRSVMKRRLATRSRC